MPEENYIGDSVYYKYDGYGIELYLNNGMGPHSKICLEPEIAEKLAKTIIRIYKL